MEASCFEAIIELTGEDGMRHLTSVVQIWWLKSRSLWSNRENHTRLARISYHECDYVLVRSLEWLLRTLLSYRTEVQNQEAPTDSGAMAVR